MKISDYTTQELYDELSSRKGVKKLSVGPYKDLKIVQSYQNNRNQDMQALAGEILFIPRDDAGNMSGQIASRCVSIV